MYVSRPELSNMQQRNLDLLLAGMRIGANSDSGEHQTLKRVPVLSLSRVKSAFTAKIQALSKRSKKRCQAVRNMFWGLGSMVGDSSLFQALNL